MNTESRDRIITVLNMIAKDMKDDASNFEGKPFNGKSVSEYLGNLGAAIAATAIIVSMIVEDLPKEQ